MTHGSVWGCSGPNRRAACRLEGATNQREKKHKKVQKLNFWECMWLKSQAPALNQEEKSLPGLTQVLHAGLSALTCLIPLSPKRQNLF